MTLYSLTNLWNNETQIRRIFGWADLLKEWNDSLIPSSYITTVINNLRASSNPNSEYDFPLSHFTTFLNDEDEGLKWLIYEIVAQRWMYVNSIQTAYLSELVDRVDVNSYFPAFVGSPLTTKTVREFLEENLTQTELDDVNMMPRLVNVTNYTFSAAPVEKKNPYGFVLRFLRPEHLEAEEGSHDTIVRIHKALNGLYDLYFKDEDIKNKAVNLTRQQLLRYLSVHLRSLVIDDDPYKSVQILPPNAPSVLYNLTRVDRAAVRDLIYDSLEVSMDTWPTA